jgi:hypothetical protein
MKLKILLTVCLVISFGYTKVKIGTNPATSTTNKNLEVDTNGKKVSVNQYIGATFIENKPSA